LLFSAVGNADPAIELPGTRAFVEGTAPGIGRDILLELRSFCHPEPGDRNNADAKGNQPRFV